MIDSSGQYYNDKPMEHCKICGKKLELTCEFDTCIECQKDIYFSNKAKECECGGKLEKVEERK